MQHNTSQRSKQTRPLSNLTENTHTCPACGQSHPGAGVVFFAAPRKDTMTPEQTLEEAGLRG